MKIKLLTRSSDLILLDKLNQMELTGETIDYKMPILPQIADAEVIVNGFGAIILTPHIAGWTADSVDAIARIIATNIERFAQGETPLTIVNPELTY
jgi:hypothetical protein